MRRLTADQVEQVSDRLLAAREGAGMADWLTDDLAPESTADVQRIIDRTNARIDRPVRGWKCYTVYKPMNPPVYSPIYDVFDNGSTIPAEISSLRLIEPEIMFRVDRTIPRRDTRYAHAELMDHVTAVVAFEIIGSRYTAVSLEEQYRRSKSQAGLSGLADNLANGCVVVGDEIANWRDVAFERTRVRMTEDDRTMIDFIGGHPFDDPFLPILVGVNRICRRHDIHAGEILIGSSSTSFFPAATGTWIKADYEGLGAVTATFAAVGG